MAELITKTCLYNFYPLKPHFYVVKLGFTGVYIIFLIFAQKTQIVGTRQNRLCEAVLTSTHNLCFKQKYEKRSGFFISKFSFFCGKIPNIFEQAIFRNVRDSKPLQHTFPKSWIDPIIVMCTVYRVEKVKKYCFYHNYQCPVKRVNINKHIKNISFYDFVCK